MIYDESISEVDETNSSATRRKGSNHDETIWRVDETNSSATRRKGSNHDESISEVDETNSSATRRKGSTYDETNWEVDATNSVHDETNPNNDSTSRKTNIVSDLTSYKILCNTNLVV